MHATFLVTLVRNMQLKFIALILVVTTSCVVHGKSNATTTTTTIAPVNKVEEIVTTLPPAHQNGQTTTPAATTTTTTMPVTTAVTTEKTNVIPPNHKNNSQIAPDISNTFEKDENNLRTTFSDIVEKNKNNLRTMFSDSVEKSQSASNRIFDNVVGKFGNKNVKVAVTPTIISGIEEDDDLSQVEEAEENKNSTETIAFLTSLSSSQIRDILCLLIILLPIVFGICVSAFNWIGCLRNVIAGRLITDVRRKLGGLDGEELRRLGGKHRLFT